MLKIATLILCICFWGSVKAQGLKGNFISGWAITLSGDSIGYYFQQKMVYNGTLKYKISLNGKAKKIKADQIKILHVGKIDYYSLKYRNNTYLMKQIIQGEISLYSVPIFNPNQPNLNLDSRYSDQEFYLKRENEVVKVRKDGFQKLMALYVSEYQELSNKLLNRQYRYEDLINIVSDFNYWYNYKR